MKVAIIGSGIAGLMAARHLHERDHDVTVFEAQDHIGGHAKTLRVPLSADGGASMPAELGVFMMDPQFIHPTMHAHVRALGVQIKPLELGFSYSSARERLAWSISSRNAGVLRDLGCLCDVMWDGVRRGRAARNVAFLRDLHRFLTHLPDLRSNPTYAGMSVRTFLEREPYDGCFVRTWLLAQMQCWWGVTAAHALDADIQVIADSMHDVARAQQFFLPDGWDTFVAGIHGPFTGRIRTGQRVERVVRTGDATRLVLEGRTEDFDRVILAVPPNAALAMLDAASSEEAAILRRFRAVHTTVFVHSDPSWMPTRTRWSIINLMEDARGAFSTFWNGSVHPGKPPVFITWGDELVTSPDPALTLIVEHWLRTLPTVDSVQASRDIATIQGRGGVWYCGAHVHALGAGRVPSLWHDNALLSGLHAAEALLA